MRLWQNIKGGELLNSDSTAEAWFRQIVKGETQNELRRNSVRPTKKQTSENDDNDGDGANNGNDRGNCVSEKQACQPRLIDFDSLCVQFFGSENEVDETENTAHLREQLDLLINKVPATCKQLFSQMVVEYLGSLDDEPVETMEKAQKTTKSAEYDFLFDWWKKNKAQGKDLSDAKTLKDVRNSFDVTLSKCRKTIQHLHNESLINFFHNDN